MLRDTYNAQKNASSIYLGLLHSLATADMHMARTEPARCSYKLWL